MATIEHRSTSINMHIVPKIDATLSNLDAVIRHNNSISIPNDFYYAATLRQYMRDVEEVKNNYSHVKNFLLTNKSLDSDIEEMSNDLLQIKKVEVKTRVQSL